MGDQIRLRSKLTIFDGPDGGGKTTVIGEYLQRNPDALYIHHHNYKHVSGGLARLYVDSISPALVGGREIVLDRCWLDETIYGNAFRGGADRIGSTVRRHIERLALTCATSLVVCLPPWENVKNCFESRREKEYLEQLDQLHHVYEQFRSVETDLPGVMFDYTEMKHSDLFNLIEEARTTPHITTLTTGGRAGTNVLLVTDPIQEFDDESPWLAAPAAPLHGNINALGDFLFTQQLEGAGVHEDKINWVTCDSLTPLELEWLEWTPSVVALTARAEEALSKIGHKNIYCTNHLSTREAAEFIASRI